jgi:hypothetical protein
VRRHQRARPGKLIHLDIKTLGRFDRPGHRVTGTRLGCRSRGKGRDFIPVAVDDATRPAGLTGSTDHDHRPHAKASPRLMR